MFTAKMFDGVWWIFDDEDEMIFAIPPEMNVDDVLSHMNNGE